MNVVGLPLWVLLLLAVAAGISVGFVVGLVRGTARGREQMIARVKQKVIEGAIAADVDRLLRGRPSHSGKR